jgi:phenylpyruvate tautomerase PptA (4-oxalocrotonate tautomerase family)
MPFYRCIAPIGVITADRKQEIVDEITRIHCQATGGLPRFVQVQFDEVLAGRPAEIRHQMMTDYTNLFE